MDLPPPGTAPLIEPPPPEKPNSESLFASWGSRTEARFDKPVNQDVFFYNPGQNALGVFDGMYPGGHKAAEITSDHIQRSLKAMTLDSFEEVTRAAWQESFQEIQTLGIAGDTTAVIAKLFHDEENNRTICATASTGDSRVYVIKKDGTVVLLNHVDMMADRIFASFLNSENERTRLGAQNIIDRVRYVIDTFDINQGTAITEDMFNRADQIAARKTNQRTFLDLFDEVMQEALEDEKQAANTFLAEQRLPTLDNWRLKTFWSANNVTEGLDATKIHYNYYTLSPDDFGLLAVSDSMPDNLTTAETEKPIQIVLQGTPATNQEISQQITDALYQAVFNRSTASPGYPHFSWRKKPDDTTIVVGQFK